MSTEAEGRVREWQKVRWGEGCGRMRGECVERRWLLVEIVASFRQPGGVAKGKGW